MGKHDRKQTPLTRGQSLSLPTLRGRGGKRKGRRKQSEPHLGEGEQEALWLDEGCKVGAVRGADHHTRKKTEHGLFHKLRWGATGRPPRRKP